MKMLDHLRDKYRESQMFFRRLQRIHYAQYVPNPAATDWNVALDQIRDKGFFSTPDFLTPQQVNSILGEIRPSLETYRQTGVTVTDVGTHEPDIELYRIRRARGLSRQMDSLFFDNEPINNLAEAYVCRDVRSYITMLEMRKPAMELSDEMLPHFDDWRHRFKALLYLTDVDLPQGPFVYFAGSHRQAPWRFEEEFDYEIHHRNGKQGALVPGQARALCRDHGYEETVITGRAGTLILFDARGLHNAKQTFRGERIILGNYFATFKDRKWKAKQFG